VWILGVILVALLVVLGYLVSWLVLSHPPRGAQFPPHYDPSAAKVALYPQNLVRSTFGGGGSILGGAICMILGVIAVGSEYGWGTFKTLMTQRPGRIPTFIGRLLAVAIVVVIFDLAVFAAAILTSLILVSIDGKPLVWPAAATVLEGMAATWLAYFVWASFGMLLAYLFKQSALAIGIGLIYMLLIEGLAINLLLPLGDWVKELQRGLPGPAMTALGGAFGKAYQPDGAVVTQPLMDGTRATITLIVYVLVFSGIAGLLIQQRDVT